jgi:aryl-alcohol dehydrogenase-like predicted oxidoreductase
VNAYRRLGQTDLQVSPVGLGCWQFSDGLREANDRRYIRDQRTVNTVIAAARRAGVNWFDTAEQYGKGSSERRLALGLAADGAKSDDVLIATKWWPAFRRAESIMETIDSRLACLAGFEIALYQIHAPLSFSSVEAEMFAMAALAREGKIQAIGVSNFSVRQMRRAHSTLARLGLPLASNQVRYNLLARGIEADGTIATAKELGVSIVAHSPLEQGLLTGKYHHGSECSKGSRAMTAPFSKKRLQRAAPLMNTLRAIAHSYSATPAQVALAWLTQFHGHMVMAIPGAKDSRQAAENSESLAIKLSPGELSAIDESSKG